MPNDWTEQGPYKQGPEQASYQLQLSPLIPMSSFVNENAYCYQPVEYPHIYPSCTSSSLSTGQLGNSFSYQSYPHHQINCSMSTQDDKIHQMPLPSTASTVSLDHNNQPQTQAQLQGHHLPCYSHLEALAYSTNSVKAEPINSRCNEVTSTSTCEFNLPINQTANSLNKNNRKCKSRSKKAQSPSEKPKKGKSCVQRKPKISYVCIIWKAINSSPNRRLRLCEIYDFMRQQWPEFFNGEYDGWKNSIRHNLSLNSCFVRLPKSEIDLSDGSKKSSKKGSYWTALEYCDNMFESQKGYDKRRPRNFIQLIKENKEPGDHSMPTDHQSYRQVQVVDEYNKKSMTGNSHENETDKLT